MPQGVPTCEGPMLVYIFIRRLKSKAKMNSHRLYFIEYNIPYTMYLQCMYKTLSHYRLVLLIVVVMS